MWNHDQNVRKLLIKNFQLERTWRFHRIHSNHISWFRPGTSRDNYLQNSMYLLFIGKLQDNFDKRYVYQPNLLESRSGPRQLTWSNTTPPVLRFVADAITYLIAGLMIAPIFWSGMKERSMCGPWWVALSINFMSDQDNQEIPLRGRVR